MNIRPYNDNMNAYLFGHYDSRGGATLIVAKRLSIAAKQYEEAFGIDDSEDFYCDPAMEDLLCAGKLWVEGPEDPHDGDELLPMYSGGDGWAVLRVHSIVQHRKTSKIKVEGEREAYRYQLDEGFEEPRDEGEVGFLLVPDKISRWENQEDPTQPADPAPLIRVFGHKEFKDPSTKPGHEGAIWRKQWFEATEDQELGEDAFGVIFTIAGDVPPPPKEA